MKRVVVGLSGGVDSSVAAYLLQQQGYEVIGLFMINWHDGSVTINNECPWIEDSNDALLVAQKLGIPFQAIDLSKEYKQRIVDYMFAEYEAGRTPNPDVLCNREIKFDVFLQAAIKLKADFVATGHYCRKDEFVDAEGKPVYRLLSGVDNNKDQSYFLCQLNQQQLSKALFPIGHLQKSEVRRIAAEQELVTAEKKDSQGLCFVGKIKLPDFLKQQLEPKEGDVVELLSNSPHYQQPAPGEFPSELARLKFLTAPYVYQPQDGRVKGKHQGAHYYTIGQRKGLNIGGTKEPLFIIATDTKTNTVYVGEGEHHPGLSRQGLFIPTADVHWIREDLRLAVGEQADYQLRIRYRQPLEPATLYMQEDGLYIIFGEAQRGVTPGQFAAWYQGEELVGSGVIA